jgi:apolipoprotein N-acyltransferase
VNEGLDAAEATNGWLPAWVAACRARCQPGSVGLQRIVALAAGMVSILAMAPFHAWPVLWLTLPALLLVADAAAATHALPSRWAPWRRFEAGRRA